MKIKTIYEDDNVVVIDKPSGVIVHPTGRGEKETVSDWFVESHGEASNVGEPITLDDGTKIDRPGIVHRLDQDTSGVLVLAKNQDTFLFLKKQFKERKVVKTYNAFVYGELNDDGVIDRSIGRSAKDFRLRSAQRGARGTMREAVTEYKIVLKGQGHSFLELNPKTGRTHQIRTHLKAINYPIVCDKLYASNSECTLGFKRLALHASKIQLEIPSLGVKDFEVPLPEDFQNAYDLLK